MNDDSSIFPENVLCFLIKEQVHHPQDYVHYSHFIFLGVRVPRFNQPSKNKIWRHPLTDIL